MKTDPALKLKAPARAASAQHHDRDFTYVLRLWQVDASWRATLLDGQGRPIREGQRQTKERMIADVIETLHELLR